MTVNHGAKVKCLFAYAIFGFIGHDSVWLMGACVSASNCFRWQHFFLLLSSLSSSSSFQWVCFSDAFCVTISLCISLNYVYHRVRHIHGCVWARAWASDGKKNETIELWHPYATATLAYIYCYSMNFNIGNEDDILIFWKTVENSTRNVVAIVVAIVAIVVFRCRKMQVSECLLNWFMRMSACARSRTRALGHSGTHVSVFQTKVFFLLCLSSQLPTLQIEDMLRRKNAVLVDALHHFVWFSICLHCFCVRFVFFSFCKLNDSKHSVHLMTWYCERKHKHNRVRGKKRLATHCSCVSRNFSFHRHRFIIILAIRYICVSFAHFLNCCCRHRCCFFFHFSLCVPFEKFYQIKWKLNAILMIYLLARSLFPLEHHRWYRIIVPNADKCIPTVVGWSNRPTHSNMIAHLQWKRKRNEEDAQCMKCEM